VGEVFRAAAPRAWGIRAAVLGFVGAPWTLPPMRVEAKSSKNYAVIKRWLSGACPCPHQLLGHLPHAIATNVRYQIDSARPGVPNWLRLLGRPASAPSITTFFRRPLPETGGGSVKATHHGHPPDFSILWQCRGCWSAWLTRGRFHLVDLDRGYGRWPCPPAGTFGVPGQCGSGAVVFHPRGDRARVVDTVLRPGGRRHILNLARHLPGTPEEECPVFFEAGKRCNELDRALS